MTGAPGGTATVLFTDLVDSAGLADRLGDDTAQTLRRAHERILRQQFERHSASLIKGTGDGFMVAFASARRAVECAADVQRAIAAQHAEGRYRELVVRIGAHTGEPVARDGDLLGADVDLAQRVSAQAEGGQILVSDLTRALARHSPSLHFAPIGTRPLKGFAEPPELFDVSWDEGRTGRRLTRFVGRVEELERLRRSLDAAEHGEGSLVLVAGDPGVGKTRLMSELAIEAADRGFQVLTGHAYETAGMPSYLPFTEALKQYARGRRPADLFRTLGATAPQVAKLLPELGDLLGDIPQPPTISPDAERYRLFEGISDFLLRIAEDAPLHLSLDDLHWTDEASVLLLQHLARRLGDARVFVAGTFRDAETDAHHPLTALVAEISRQQTGYCLALRPFGRDEGRTLIEAASARAPTARIADALYDITEGNPFFTEEIILHLQEEGRDLADAAAAVAEWAIPDTVRQVIRHRLSKLSREAGQVLAYSSVLGRDLSLAKVAAIAERDETYLIEQLDQALATGLVVEAGDGYAFAHPLIQETLYQELSAPRRRQLHRQVARALEQLFAEDLPPAYLAELASHYFQAASADDAERAAEYATRAAEHALSQYAWEEAADLYRIAHRALEMTGSADGARLCDALLGAAEAYGKAGRTAEADETHLRAIDIARGERLTERLARAALGFSWATGEATTNERVVRLLEEALHAVGEEDSELRARMLGRLAAARYYSEPRERTASRGKEAIEVARRVGDQATLANTLYSYLQAIRGPDTVEEQLAAATELVRTAEQAGDPELAAQGHAYRAANLLELGDAAGMKPAIEELARIAQELRQPSLLVDEALLRATLALLEGRFDEAEELAGRARALGEQAMSPTAFMTYAIQMFAIRRDQGRLDELEGAVATFVGQFPALRWQIALAYLHSEQGRMDEARSEFEQIMEKGLSDLPHDFAWLIGMTLLAQTCAALGDDVRAPLLYDLLLPYSGRCVVVSSGLSTNGAADRYLGLLAATRRRWPDAEQHFEAALEMNAKLGAKPLVAHTQYDYATMLAARGRAGDRERAAHLAGLSLSAAGELRMHRLQARAAALQEALT